MWNKLVLVVDWHEITVFCVVVFKFLKVRCPYILKRCICWTWFKNISILHVNVDILINEKEQFKLLLDTI